MKRMKLKSIDVASHLFFSKSLAERLYKGLSLLMIWQTVIGYKMCTWPSSSSFNEYWNWFTKLPSAELKHDILLARNRYSNDEIVKKKMHFSTVLTQDLQTGRLVPSNRFDEYHLDHTSEIEGNISSLVGKRRLFGWIWNRSAIWVASLALHK